MLFWAGILVGAFFARLAIKMGFYETLTMLFNIVISVYLAVFLAPTLMDIIPGAGETQYSSDLAILSTGIAAFLILHCISYTFLTGQFSVAFPKICNTLGAAFLGFLAGFLVWSFVTLLIYISPIAQRPLVQRFGFGGQFKQTNISYISWWCDLVNKVVSPQANEYRTGQVISELIQNAKKKMEEPSEASDVNEPAGTDVGGMAGTS